MILSAATKSRRDSAADEPSFLIEIYNVIIIIQF